MKKKIWLGILVVALIGSAFYVSRGGEKSVYTSDTTIRGNYAVASDKHIILKNNARLTVEGDMTVDGMISCDGGSLSLVVLGKLKVNGRLYCALDEHSSPTVPNMVLALTSKHIEFGKDAEVAGNGHVTIIGDANDSLENEQSIERFFNETGEDTGNGARVGPLVTDEPSKKTTTTNGSGDTTSDTEFILRGKWHIGDGAQLTSDLSVPLLLNNVPLDLFYVNASPQGTLTVEDLTFSGPLGSAGKDDSNANCSAKGQDGASGARFRAIAGNMSLTNSIIHLGSGGKGGNAKTKVDCDRATAVGGNGGLPGNIKLTAMNLLTVKRLTIIPGKGGNGGDSQAHGENGIDACPATQGGIANATAGKGSDNKAALSVSGGVVGVENITLGRVDGGTGGRAIATAGDGGNGNECGCKGGLGGDAKAEAGDGGNTLVSLPVGTAEAHGGDGGDTNSHAGTGGAGGNCTDRSGVGEAQHGGQGGGGGRGEASAGKGGAGTTARGNSGKTVDRSGGKGGKGGEACAPGQGGLGGVGFPVGDNGQDGNSLCVKATPQATAPSTMPMIKAILFHGKYLPINQLTTSDLSGCGETYWHSIRGQVTATDGYVVTDTLLACDFGKVKETAVIDTLAQMATATPIIFEGR